MMIHRFLFVVLVKYLEVANYLSGKFHIPVKIVNFTSPLLFIFISIIIYKLTNCVITLISTSLPARGSAANSATPVRTPSASVHRPAEPVTVSPNISNRSQEYTLNYEANSILRNRYFNFKLKYKGGSWRAYILNSMNYGTRSSDAHSTHRLYDSELNLNYVCWSVPIQDLEQITKIAKMWADATMRYIKTGNFR